MKLFARLWMCIKVALQLLNVNFQIIKGLWVIGKLPRPCVSIFGGSHHFKEEDRYRALAAEAARLLIGNNISVITGGGPGIMEAANCGSLASPLHEYRTVKIAITGLSYQESMNTCYGTSVTVSSFFARKWLLIDYSVGFLVFPGGLGTLDELSDLMNLMSTGKLKRRVVVLIGVDYWKPYKEFFDQARTQNFLNTSTPDLIITDTIEDAVKLVTQHCEECRVHYS